MEVVPENTSGQGRSAVIPQEIRGWNWGAFLFGWLWGICNSTWIALLAAIPYIGIIMHIVLGVKGNEWAWRHKKWDSIEHFKRTQRNWGIAGLVVLVVGVIIFIAVLPVPSTAPTNSYQVRFTPESYVQLAAGMPDNKIYNADWDFKELYEAISSINKQYYTTHTYIEGEFVCKEMAISVWNRLLTEGIVSVFVVGNLDSDNASLAESNHVWLLVYYYDTAQDWLHGIPAVFIVETTNGETYLRGVTDLDVSEQYMKGYCYLSPSKLTADIGERW